MQTRPLSYAERLAQRAGLPPDPHARATATSLVRRLVEKATDAPPPPAAWSELKLLADAYLRTGQAPDMLAALGRVATEQPGLYQRYVREQRQGLNRGGVQKTAPTAPEAPHWTVATLQEQVAVLKAQGLSHVDAWGQLLATPEGQRLQQAYYAAHPHLRRER